MKSIFKITILAGVCSVFLLVSCKKFIKEELVTQLTEDYYKTDQGLEDLVKSAYVPLKWKLKGGKITINRLNLQRTLKPKLHSFNYPLNILYI